MFCSQNDFSCAHVCKHFFFSYDNMALAKPFEGGYYYFCRLLRRKEVSVTCPASPVSPAVSKAHVSRGIRVYPKPGSKRRANQAAASKTLITFNYIYPLCPFPTPASIWSALFFNTLTLLAAVSFALQTHHLTLLQPQSVNFIESPL